MRLPLLIAVILCTVPSHAQLRGLPSSAAAPRGSIVAAFLRAQRPASLPGRLLLSRIASLPRGQDRAGLIAGYLMTEGESAAPASRAEALAAMADFDADEARELPKASLDAFRTRFASLARQAQAEETVKKVTDSWGERSPGRITAIGGRLKVPSELERSSRPDARNLRPEPPAPRISIGRNTASAITFAALGIMGGSIVPLIFSPGAAAAVAVYFGLWTAVGAVMLKQRGQGLNMETFPALALMISAGGLAGVALGLTLNTAIVPAVAIMAAMFFSAP